MWNFYVKAFTADGYPLLFNLYQEEDTDFDVGTRYFLNDEPELEPATLEKFNRNQLLDVSLPWL